MQTKQILPTILMAIDFAAAIPYFIESDIRMGVYWVSAGMLTLSLTWL